MLHCALYQRLRSARAQEKGPDTPLDPEGRCAMEGGSKESLREGGGGKELLKEGGSKVAD